MGLGYGGGKYGPTGAPGSVTTTEILDGTIVNADISTAAEILVSKMADGAARQVLQTDAAGTGVEWTDNVDLPGTLDVTGVATFDTTSTFTGAPTFNATPIVRGTAPTVAWRDSDCTDADNNFTIAADATDTGSGTEDIDVTLSQQINGTLTAWLTADADGNITFGSARPVVANGGGALTGTWSDLGTVTTVDINGGTLDGVTIGGSSAAAGTFTTVTASRAGIAGTFTNSTDDASVQVLVLDGDRATMADNDEAYVSMRLSNDGGTQTEFGRLTWVATDVNAGTSVDGRLDFAVVTAGTLADELQLDGLTLSPSTSDGLALGTTSLMWGDLFLASGGVINFNAGDITVTHSANFLAFAGGKYSFDSNVQVGSGTSAALFHAIGADGGTYGLGISATSVGVRFEMNASSIAMRGVDNTLSASYQPITLGGSIVVIEANGADEKMRFTSTACEATANVVPKTNDGAALGTTSLKWSDLWLASGAVIDFNSGDVVLTHAANLLTFTGGDLAMGAATFFLRSITAGITASTTQTQGNGALTTEVNEISVCANANDTVTLPAAVAGRFCLVINNGAQTAQVFPASGDNLGAGVDTSTTIAAGSRKLFVAFDTTNWEPVI